MSHILIRSTGHVLFQRLSFIWFTQRAQGQAFYHRLTCLLLPNCERWPKKLPALLLWAKLIGNHHIKEVRWFFLKYNFLDMTQNRNIYGCNPTDVYQRWIMVTIDLTIIWGQKGNTNIKLISHENKSKLAFILVFIKYLNVLQIIQIMNENAWVTLQSQVWALKWFTPPLTSPTLKSGLFHPLKMENIDFIYMDTNQNI